MLYSYFRTAFRSLLKNKAFSFLNILGLAIGMACCMVIFQYVTFEKSYDTFHSNNENLYRVQYNSYKDGITIFECAAAVPAVGKAMKENFPEIEDYAIAFPSAGVVSYGDINFREERVQLATPSWLTMFDWELIQGDIASALDGPKKMVLTESTARKYFGTEDPVGKSLKWSNGWFTADYLVTGVVKDVPDNSHIRFSILASHSTLREASGGDSETSWGWYDHNTYVSLQPGVDPKDFDKRFAEYLYSIQGTEFEESGRLSEFLLQPINDIHLKSSLLQESEPEENGDAQSVYFLGVLAIFILVIAWVNYINLASAKSMERAREVGVRKVLGAYKGQLIRQFIVESIVVNLLAAMISLGIVALVLPYFNNLTGSPLSLALIFNSGTWVVVLSVFLGGAFLSGIYPAFVLSSFRPIVVLKGKLSTSGKGAMLRKSLVTFQFLASVFLIAGTIIVYKQLEFLKNRDLGFKMESTLVIKGPSVLQVDSLYANYLEGFKNEVTSIAAISGLSTATNVPGDEIFWTYGAKRAEAPVSDLKTVYHVGIDYEYVPNFDIKVLHGRNYDRSFPTDEAGIMLNLAATQFLGFENPEDAIGEKVTDGGEESEVIGVLDNYNQMSLKSTVAPIIYRLQPNGNSFYALKLQSNNTSLITEQVKASWDNFFPGNPMDYFYLDSFYNRQYAKDDQFGTVFSIFSVLAIIVSCLGLFGLSAFSALQRTKEIGVRKVLGASVSSILLLLSREYLYLILFAVGLGVPLTYLVMNNWLDNFAYRTEISWLTFALAAFIVLGVALLTVSFQTVKSARTNPSNTLRNE